MARYALIIGISKYGKFIHLPKAATDAEAIAQATLMLIGSLRQCILKGEMFLCMSSSNSAILEKVSKLMISSVVVLGISYALARNITD